jgi:ribosomal protein S18 acetylase RimI-like enzyme
MHAVDCDVLSTLDDRTYHDLCALLRQLSETATAPSFAEMNEVTASSSTRLLVARVDDRAVGMLTLCVARVPTGITAHIEDVVVETVARGQGIGRILVQAAITLATELGARHIDLTSRPSRVAANRLYHSLGFTVRDTNLYRYVVLT